MKNTTKHRTLKLVPVRVDGRKRQVVYRSENNISLDVILGISIIISLLGIIILG